jgi:hypothetical protein
MSRTQRRRSGLKSKGFESKLSGPDRTGTSCLRGPKRTGQAFELDQKVGPNFRGGPESGYVQAFKTAKQKKVICTHKPLVLLYIFGSHVINSALSNFLPPKK